MADRVIKLLRSTYADFAPTLATEKLRTKHGIDLAKETVRQLQIAVGLWIPRKLRPPKIQQPRMRRACIGELRGSVTSPTAPRTDSPDSLDYVILRFDFPTESEAAPVGMLSPVFTAQVRNTLAKASVAD
jgi:hypothetical protein